MPAKIRLQRHGRKKRPYYHIVIADGRAPRDGKYIENIGSYNPIEKPAQIELDFDKAVQWVMNGAQPTDTVKNILSYKGVMHKVHLLKGVKKGALTEEQAQAKFDAWMKDKEAKIQQSFSAELLAQKEDKKKRLAAETKVNEERAAEIAKKRLAEVEAEKGEEEVAAEATEAPAEDATVEEPKAEEKPAEEPKAEEVKEEEKPVEEKSAEEAKEEKSE